MRTMSVYNPVTIITGVFLCVVPVFVVQDANMLDAERMAKDRMPAGA